MPGLCSDRGPGGGTVGAVLDEQADRFHDFYERHLDPLYRLARRRVGPDDAEDVVAETFVQAYKSLPPHLVEDDDGARAWLFVVLRNRLTSAARRRTTAERKQSLVATPAESADHYDLGGDVEDALALLPERQRLVLELRFIADLDVRAVAAILSLSEEGVRALTHRALRGIRQLVPGAATGSASP